MSYEAFGDNGDDNPGYVTEERAAEMFISGAQIMREMLARFVEWGGDTTTANSIRANWVPDWGKDPGKWDEPIPSDPWSA